MELLTHRLLRCMFFARYMLMVDNLRYLENSSRSFDCGKSFNSFLSRSNLFHEDSLVHIVSSGNTSTDLELQEVEQFFKDRHKIVTESSIKEVRDILTLFPDFYVFFTSDYDNLNLLQNTVNQVMLYTQSWNSKAKFLLMATVNVSKEYKSLIIDSFNFLWSKNVFRVAIALCVKSSEKVALFSSSPYTKRHRTCRNITGLDQIQKINLLDSDSSFEISGYSFEVPMTFLGCPLLAKTYPFSPYSVALNTDGVSNPDITYSTGLEVELVRLLAKVSNFSLTIKTPNYMQNPWDQVLPSGARIGMLIDLLSYKIDIGFAGAIPSTPDYFHLSQVFPLFFNSMSWYVPDPEFVPGWRLLVYAFSKTSWLFLTVTMITFGVIYNLMWKAKPRDARPIEPISLSIVRMTLGTSARCYPRLPHLRIMLVAWSLFSLNVTIMYSTQLFSEFTDRPLDHGLTTLEELHSSNLRTCMSSLYRAFYITRTEGVIRELIEDAVLCDNMDEDVKNFLAERDFSLLTKDDHISLLINMKKERVHKLAQKFITYPVSMLNTKGAVHVDALKRLILNVSESGINQKWLYDVERNVTFMFNTKNNTVSEESSNKALKKEDFMWLYKLLLLGDVVSFLVFVVELGFGKCYKPRAIAKSRDSAGYWLVN